MHLRSIAIVCICGLWAGVSGADQPPAPKEKGPPPHFIYTPEQLRKVSSASDQFWQVSSAEAETAWAAVRAKIQSSKLPSNSPLRTKLENYAVGFAGRIDKQTGKKLIAVSASTDYSPTNLPGLNGPLLTIAGDPFLFALYDLETGSVVKLAPNGESR